MSSDSIRTTERPSIPSYRPQRTQTSLLVLTYLLLLVVHTSHAFVSKTTTTLPSSTISSLYATVPTIDDYTVLDNGRIVGTIFNHPTLPNGDTITTSPLQGRARPQATVTTTSGSQYKLGSPAVWEGTTQDLQRQAKQAFGLNGLVVGDETQEWLLAGKPRKSTSGKSQLYKGYKSQDGLPVGTAVVVKISSNWEALEREAKNYQNIARGNTHFVQLYQYLPDASIQSRQFRNRAALVLERGVIDLKRYIVENGALEGKRLRQATVTAVQCLQSIHGRRYVWTDLKSENFVVDASGTVRGIDLESCCRVQTNPVDYSPEGTPPEFATAFLQGDGPDFELQYSYDIWSLGMLLYELSTGRGYFGGMSPAQITKTLKTIKDVDVSAVPNVQLRNLIGNCLTIDAKKRPSLVQLLLHPYFVTSGIGPLSFW